MGRFYQTAIRPILFKMDPEVAHERAIAALRLAGQMAPARGLIQALFGAQARHPTELFGLRFPNRVGLAAGMDKNGEAVPALAAMGFGFLEVGTVTPKGQPGNPKPRMFRYPAEHALINRMGFNNKGADFMAWKLGKSYPRGGRKVPIGVNIGKAKATPLEEAVLDYQASFRILASHADFFVLNVSSPNTQGLRDLQEKEKLAEICRLLKLEADAYTRKHPDHELPVLLKIAPDCSWEQIEDILEVLLAVRFSGIIATNTTIARPGVFSSVHQAGGLSGAPLTDRATDVIRFIHDETGGKLPIIGVGGIMDIDSAKAKLDAGASLIQVYTGFVYGGPGFAKFLVRGLDRS